MTPTGEARIGPNAILQLVPVLDDDLGVAGREALLRTAGIEELPDGSSMIGELPIARLHQAMRRQAPDAARSLARRAGLATGDYILANRIPGFAQRLLTLMPGSMSAPLLARAIEKHAWTFVGSGRFRVVSTSPMVFEIEDNPVVKGEQADSPVCDWHAAVFERLYRQLVDQNLRVIETRCAAVDGRVCRFEFRREASD